MTHTKTTTPQEFRRCTDCGKTAILVVAVTGAPLCGCCAAAERKAAALKTA